MYRFPYEIVLHVEEIQIKQGPSDTSRFVDLYCVLLGGKQIVWDSLGTGQFQYTL